MPISFAAPLLIALFLASAFPWLLILRARLGHLLAVPTTAGGALLLFLATLTISHLLDANYLVALIVASVAVGIVGAIIASRTPGVLRRPGRYAVALWCAPLLGAVLWIGTVLLAQLAPGMSRFGWIMNGDALNNLYFAHLIIGYNGIALGAPPSPVTLPAALIATGIGTGSPSSGSAAAALAQDLAGFTLVWTILLAVLCVAMGAVIASLVPNSRLRLVVIVGALGSLLPLTWFVAGLTIQWGYFNVDVVLPIALGGWLVYLGSRAHPFAALLCLVGFTVLSFTAWTPLAALTIALGVALVIRNFARFRAIRRGYWIAFAVCCVAGIAFLARTVDFPSLFATDGALSASGSGFVGFVNLWWIVPIVAVVVALTALLVRGRTVLPTTSAAIAILIAGVAVSGGLVYLASGGPAELFDAYYPKKFAWILLVILGTIALSFLAGALAGRVRTSLLAAMLVLAVVAAALLPPGTWPEMVQRQPVARIAGDFVRHNGESTVDTILKLTTAAHPTILWQSGDPDEPIINQWLLLSHGGLAHGNPKLLLAVGAPYFLYRSSGRYTDPGVFTLCKIVPLLHGTPLVITANPKLRGELKTSCPDAAVTIHVSTSLVGPRPSKTGQNWQTDGIEGPFS
ncbi:MAG TPA: hypothetical protein VGF80_02635 [Galbitalea sp.]